MLGNRSAPRSHRGYGVAALGVLLSAVLITSCSTAVPRSGADQAAPHGSSSASSPAVAVASQGVSLSTPPAARATDGATTISVAAPAWPSADGTSTADPATGLSTTGATSAGAGASTTASSTDAPSTPASSTGAAATPELSPTGSAVPSTLSATADAATPTASPPPIVPRPTEIWNLTISPDAPTVGTVVVVRYDLMSQGKPLPGVMTEVVAGATSVPVTVDDRGHGEARLSGLPIGRNTIIVRFQASATQDGASAPVTVTVTDPQAPSDGNSSGGTASSAPAAGSPCPASARACIDLTHNKTWLQSGGKIVYGPVPITSGRPGHRTPTGTFQVYWKDKNHRSSLFDGAPMPNSVFFVGGIAFHQGSLSVASHGCIHLSWDASQAYWDNLRNGDIVFVFGYAPY